MYRHLSLVTNNPLPIAAPIELGPRQEDRPPRRTTSRATRRPGFNALSEMTVLALHRPGPDAAADTVAAWYDAKERLHAQLAAEDDSDAELGYAVDAHEHADRLRRDLVPVPARLRPVTPPDRPAA